MAAFTTEKKNKSIYLKFKGYVLSNITATQLLISKYMPCTPYPI